MYRGSCLCGKIKIQVIGPIESIIHCHCSKCRKSCGTAYATNGFVKSNNLIIIDKLETLRSYEVSTWKHRHFCGECASPIYSSNAESHSRIRIRLGILNSDIEERPTSHNCVTSKANWEDLDAELPRYEGHEPSR